MQHLAATGAMADGMVGDIPDNNADWGTSVEHGQICQFARPLLGILRYPDVGGEQAGRHGAEWWPGEFKVIKVVMFGVFVGRLDVVIGLSLGLTARNGRVV